MQNVVILTEIVYDNLKYLEGVTKMRSLRSRRTNLRREKYRTRARAINTDH